MNNKVENIKIFGCKVNKYFANKWYNVLNLKGELGKGIILLATCVVTDRAKKKFIKEIKDLFLKEGIKKIFLTGCGAFDQGQSMARKLFFDLYKELIQFEDKIELLPEDPNEYNFNLRKNSALEYLNSKIKLKKISKKDFLGGLTTRKFIIIQTGCDSFCTFCLTVHKRGRHKSRPVDDIIREINEFVDIGGNEIVLTGVNLCAWGATTTTAPKTSQFSFLLKNILSRTTIKRIRISSLGPEFLDDEFFDIISDKRFLPYFHFSFQSFSNKILSSMRRNYNLNLLRKHIDRLYKNKGLLTNIGGDIIVGFPGEDNKEFDITYNIIKDYKLTQIHGFPFSPHEIGETVPAGNFIEQISNEVKRYRVKKLQDLIKKNKSDLIEKTIGKKVSILIEQEKNGFWVGWTDNYLQVGLKGDYKKNQIIEKKISKKDFLSM